MRHSVALENLVNVETTSELLTGLRLVPGSALDSALYKAMAQDPDLEETAAMPPVGVDLIDSEAVMLVREWIDNMPPETD